MLRVLSLGAGVQSTTLLLLSCRGRLPRLDAAVFADTGWEPVSVYRHLAWLEAEAASHGIPVYRVFHGHLQADVLASKTRSAASGYQASLPFFVLNSDGTKGMVQRQCTRAYKVRPVERFIRHMLLGLGPRQRPRSGAVEQWFGISADEATRMRSSDVLWRVHAYPLCNYPRQWLPSPMSRADCTTWLKANYPQLSVPRSACVGCPYRSDEDWHWMINEAPQEWLEAVEFDRQIRHIYGMGGQTFLHRHRVPLDEAVRVSNVQTNTWLNDCTGACGV